MYHTGGLHDSCDETFYVTWLVLVKAEVHQLVIMCSILELHTLEVASV
jgi:hypothetical protein